VKMMKVEDRLENVGRGREISMTGSRNVEVNKESLRLLDIAGGTSAKWVGRSRDVECWKRHGGQRKEARRPLNASISDRRTERLYWQ
jgi:hypothetical protein